MSEHGAVLQSYNQELVKHIEYLKNQRDFINAEIEEDEKVKKSIVSKLDELNHQLKAKTINLESKYRKRDVCEKAIKEAETGLLKIIESSQVLLSLMQRETESLNLNS